MMRYLASRGLIAIAITLMCCTPSLAAEDPGPIKIRDADLDGAGPSHVLVAGDYVLVIDPNLSKITRFDRVSFKDSVACTYRRDFRPWRSVSSGGELRIVSETEPFGTKAFASKYTMRLPVEQIAKMTAGDCPFAIVPYDGQRDAPDRMTWPQGTPGPRGNPTAGPAVVGGRGGFTITPASRAQIVSARILGPISGGRTAVQWTELAPWVRKGDGLGTGGHVETTVFVGIFSNPKQPDQVIRIADHRYDAAGGVTGMYKRGFQYLAVTPEDTLLLMGTTEPSTPFKIHRFPINASLKTIVFNGNSTEKEGADISAEASSSPLPPAAELPPETWFTVKIRPAMIAYTHLPWETPETAMRPCSPKEMHDTGICAIEMSANGDIIPYREGEHRLYQGRDAKNDIRYVAPRHLVGAGNAQSQVGMPYSFAGDTRPDMFLEGLAAYAAPTGTPRPIGHIRDALTYLRYDAAGKVLRDRNGKDKIFFPSGYPLGIDCSRFIAAIFGVEPRDTADMVALKDTKRGVAPDNLPSGPIGGCSQPVPDATQLRPGDILVKKGHVVIFGGTLNETGLGEETSSLGFAVYEAASRCGRVCRSIYSPDFFNGWWIFRMTQSKNCPDWLKDLLSLPEAKGQAR